MLSWQGIALSVSPAFTLPLLHTPWSLKEYSRKTSDSACGGYSHRKFWAVLAIPTFPEPVFMVGGAGTREVSMGNDFHHPAISIFVATSPSLLEKEIESDKHTHTERERGNQGARERKGAESKSKKRSRSEDMASPGENGFM